jgi:hypothetical protein
MEIITSPDDLNQGTEVTIDRINKTIELHVAGNLSENGVTGQAFYSFLKEEWRNDAALIAYNFPIVVITPKKFKLVGWMLANDTTRNLLRNAKFSEHAGVIWNNLFRLVNRSI